MSRGRPTRRATASALVEHLAGGDVLARPGETLPPSQKGFRLRLGETVLCGDLDCLLGEHDLGCVVAVVERPGCLADEEMRPAERVELREERIHGGQIPLLCFAVPHPIEHGLPGH